MANGDLDPRTEGMLLVGAAAVLLIGYLFLQNKKGTPPSGGKASPCPPLGDVSGDGMVTDEDAQLVLNAVAHLTTLSPEELSRADVDRNGVVDAVDALLIRQFLAFGVNTFACTMPVTHPPHP